MRGPERMDYDLIWIVFLGPEGWREEGKRAVSAWELVLTTFSAQAAPACYLGSRTNTGPHTCVPEKRGFCCFLLQPGALSA